MKLLRADDGDEAALSLRLGVVDRALQLRLPLPLFLVLPGNPEASDHHVVRRRSMHHRYVSARSGLLTLAEGTTPSERFRVHVLTMQERHSVRNLLSIAEQHRFDPEASLTANALRVGLAEYGQIEREIKVFLWVVGTAE